ncbi:MAG: alpha/beta hydrolase [Deltaproteobacteria bacterium]|nr:alpha/beta hydrolase [Deltaproteobacteria bacterium]
MSGKRFWATGFLFVFLSIFSWMPTQLWASPVNLAPVGPVTPVTFDDIIDPAGNRLVLDFKEVDAVLLPAFTTPESDIGRAVTAVLYVYFYATGDSLILTGQMESLGSVFVCDLLSAVFPMSSLEGLSFDVYYGYTLDDGTLRYSAYRVTLVRQFEDMSYVAVNPQERQRLDVYYPEGIAHPTVLMFVPGGAWKQGDKDLYKELARTFSGYYGYATVVINYRLSNPDDGAAVHPDHVEDVAAAFAWVKRNIASYGGDPESVYLFGQSAGAHLVSLLSTDDQYLKSNGFSLSDIRGTVSMSGVYNLYDFSKYPMNPLGLSLEDILMYKAMLLNAFGGWDQTTLDGASPWQFINERQPPMLVVSTEDDMPGFEAEADRFIAFVQGAGLGVSLEGSKIALSDYSSATWAAATAMAAAEPAVSDYVGHYAEVVAINTVEYNSRSTRLVVDFVAAH